MSGTDNLDGGPGDDILVGGAGGDVLAGGADIDALSYQGDTVGVEVRIHNLSATGGDAAGDTFSGIENLIGGAGGDFLAGNSAPNQLFGQDGNDMLRGGSANDLLEGGANDDILYGQNDADTLRGQAGDDYLEGGPGADVLDGGAGAGDTLSYANSTGNVSVRLFNLSASGGDATGDVFSNMEFLMGGLGNDYLVGDAQANEIRGGAGTDQVRGGSGNDLLDGGEDSDIYLGGPDADQFKFSSNLTGDVDTLSDFTPGDGDVIVLRDNVFTNLATMATPNGAPLGAAEFVVGAAATTADHRIVYDSTTGAMFYDADGTGGTAQIQFALLIGTPTVQASDILVA